MKRKGKISRKTKETSISVDLNIDGKGKYKIDTGIGFLNHMLEQLSKHSSIDMSIKAKRPPISPPFNLSKFDLIKSIDKKTIVALREEIFKKANG